MSAAMDWQPIDKANPAPGTEIVIRLHPTKAVRAVPKMLGLSVHQIAQWDADGDLRCRGHLVPFDVVEGFIPLPKASNTET